MPGTLKTEAVVLRSLRYGEADRILHLYTPHRGRVGAIAKGVRRTRSRFGGRLEPFSRVALVLHVGRSDLHTVTSADSVWPHHRLRESAVALDTAARACDAVSRLFEDAEPHPPVFHLLCNELALLDELGGREDFPALANQIAFRLKLLVAAGLTPQLAACASCGEREHLTGFSGAQGGVVCQSCEAGSFALSAEAHAFLTGALAVGLRDVPAAPDRALRQAERAVRETAEHHANVRLRAASSG